jgi:hypothetical protein
MVRENSQNWTRMSPPLARPYEVDTPGCISLNEC